MIIELNKKYLVHFLNPHIQTKDKYVAPLFSTGRF